MIIINTRYDKYQVKYQPSSNKDHKKLKISLSNAIIDNGTMMVKRPNATITINAMIGPWWSIYITINAIFLINL